jgi:Lrp/AsnC family transcriptional regulator, regulator for asnA, asnC and gidA
MTDNTPYLLDDVDAAILRSLQTDGRKSFSDLAKDMNIAVSTVSKRYTQLVENNVVKVVGRVDPNRVGLNAYASIFLKIESVENIDKVVEAIAQLPEISFLGHRTGDYQLELNVMCRNNNHLMEFMNNHIHPLGSITKYEINMYLRVYKWGQPHIFY